MADLGGQLHIFQSGEVLHQIVELEYEPDIIPAVLGQLSLGVGGNLLAVQQDFALGQGVHSAQNI